MGGFIAAGEPTRHIPAAHKPGQHRRGDVAGLRCGVAGVAGSGRSWRCRRVWRPAAGRATSRHPAEPPVESLPGRRVAAVGRRGVTPTARRPGCSFPSNCTGVSSDSDSSRATTSTRTVLGCIPGGGTVGAVAAAGESLAHRDPGRRGHRRGAARGCADRAGTLRRPSRRGGDRGPRRRWPTAGPGMSAVPAAVLGGVDIDESGRGHGFRCGVPPQGHSGPPSSRSRAGSCPPTTTPTP